MELITLPKMRINQMQAFAEKCITICKPFKALAPAIKAVENVYESFVESMQKDKASEYDKKEFDRKRDAILTGFYGAIRSEKNFPHTDSNAIETLETLVDAAFKYGTKVSKLSYDEETATIDNILSEVKNLDLSALKDTGLSRWIPLLEQTNKDFKDVASKFAKDSSNAAVISAAVKKAPELEVTLEKLFALMFSHITISQHANMIKAYNEISLLRDSL